MRTMLSFECNGKQAKKYDRYQDYWFVIPDLLEDEEYVEWVKNSDKYVMLDNGMYEHGFPDTDNLLTWARSINADEIVLPDYLYKTRETIDAMDKFIATLSQPELLEFKWMMVVQAPTIRDWVKAYSLFNKRFGDIAYTIGVPRAPQKELGFRATALQWLKDSGEIVAKPHHLLGMNHPSEILTCSGICRSMDTGWPFKVDKHTEILRRMNYLRDYSTGGYDYRTLG